MKKYLFFPFLAMLFFSCENSTDVLIVDYQVNVAKPSYETNYFNWSFADKKIEDKFDTVTQASMKKTTGEFNSVRYAGRAEDKKLTLPAGLRGLFLYAIADWSLLEGDNLNVSEKEGVITVRYAHHGKAYQLTTDANGNFDVLQGAKMAKDFADVNDNKEYTIREAYLIGDDPTMMKNLNWQLLNLKSDRYTQDASHHFEGKLKFEFKDSVLHISGKLYKK